MDIKELLDEDAFDNEKLFNENEYSTLIINREGFSKKQNTTADLIEDLLEKEISREESEEIFKKLKESNATELLVSSIKEAKRVEDKTRLVAACWECGLDFSGHFLLFVELACHPDFQLALEALSVVESVESGLSAETIRTAVEIADNAKNSNEQLVAGLKEHLNRIEHGG